ncbi:TetR/AcrR family transcriptional regulator [Paeniglutamicibacter antarcticus]|uniref:HTH tetR-type domain-containing protein n=1 Tax=Paeniglutamicibacter antarcticus TaxID=494023 RepID=A0ABP9TQR5_9MICC
MVASEQAAQGAKRSYRSLVRQEGALDTRRRIAAAAQDLFEEFGFSGTTVANIATRAGVAVPTVYSTFGSKSAIVSALLSQMEHDADSASWARRIAQETDPRRKLAVFAQWTTGLFSSSKAIIRAVHGAAADPAINELHEQGNRNRRDGLSAVISSLGQDNSLLTGLSEELALDRAWMLTGVELYLSATEGCRWTDIEYQQWLTTLLQQQLLDNKRPTSP